jgi:hypothetical protein
MTLRRRKEEHDSHMEVVLLVGIGIVGWLLGAIFTLSLCRAAARG